jgi:hypothetical protein
MKFQIGDQVREGPRVGTVTDVGTVLIQVLTSEGTPRVVFPWDLIPVRAPHDGIGSSFRAQVNPEARR